VVRRRRPLQSGDAGKVATQRHHQKIGLQPSDGGVVLGIVEVDGGARHGKLARSADGTALVVESHFDVAYRGEVLLELDLIFLAQARSKRCVLFADRVEDRMPSQAQLLEAKR